MPDWETLEQARAAVRPLAERLDLFRRTRAFDAHRWSGARPDLPVLHLEDVSAYSVRLASFRASRSISTGRACARATASYFAALTPPSTRATRSTAATASASAQSELDRH